MASLEMLLALANNNINAYEQSLEFTEGVQVLSHSLRSKREAQGDA
jgi:hypothetical protein